MPLVIYAVCHNAYYYHAIVRAGSFETKQRDEDTRVIVKQYFTARAKDQILCFTSQVVIFSFEILITKCFEGIVCVFNPTDGTLRLNMDANQVPWSLPVFSLESLSNFQSVSLHFSDLC